MKIFIYFVIISFLIFYVNSTTCKVEIYPKTYYYYSCKKCNAGVGCTKCDDYYYVENGYCQKCPNSCKNCFGVDVCAKCDNGFVKFRESNKKIECIPRDDRMKIDKCSMYIMGSNDDFKCVDCEKGYQFNFDTQKCETSTTKINDLDDII